MWGTVGARLGAVALATLAMGLAGCGGDDGEETSGAEASSGTQEADAEDLTRFLMRAGEEPGFRPGAQPGAMPRSRQTITGVDALVEEFDLPQGEARRIRRNGFVSTTLQPIRGPRTAGVSTVDLYETAAGAERSVAQAVRPSILRRQFPPHTDLRYFTVPGVPSARGFIASKPHVGNVFWVQGRCLMILGNQGPGPFVGPLSTGVRAIHERTNGECP